MSDWRAWLGLAALFLSVRVAAERPEAPSFRLDGAARPERYEAHLARAASSGSAMRATGTSFRSSRH